MHTSRKKLPVSGCFSSTWLKRIWPHNTNPPKKKQNIYYDHANNISEMFSVSSSFCYLFWECITLKIWILLKQAFTKRWIRTVRKTLCMKGRGKKKRNIIKTTNLSALHRPSCKPGRTHYQLCSYIVQNLHSNSLSRERYSQQLWPH